MVDLSPYFQKRLRDKVELGAVAAAASHSAGRPRPGPDPETIALKCSRALWFSLKGFRPLAANGLLARAAERGRLARRLVARDLRRAGYTIEWNAALECGCIYGLTRWPHLLEVQAVPEATFRRLEQFGLGAAIDLEITLHCRLAFTRLERALFVAENKNTQELHFEKVRFDPDIFRQSQGVLAKLRGLKTAPAGCFDDTCLGCGFRGECWE